MLDEDKVEIPPALPWLLATLRDDLARLYVEAPQKKPTLKRKAPAPIDDPPHPLPPAAPAVVVSGPFDSSEYMVSVLTQALEEGDWRDDDLACDRFKDLSPPRRARLRLQDIALQPPVTLNATVSNPEALHRQRELDAEVTLEQHETTLENDRATRAVAKQRLATIDEDGDFNPLARDLPRTPKRRRLENHQAGYAFSAAGRLDLSDSPRATDEDSLPMPPLPTGRLYP